MYQFLYNGPSYRKFKSHDSSVSIALGYGLDDRGSRVRFPAGAGNFSLHHRVQNSSGAHQASYPMDTRDSFPGGKAAGA
jgi:glutamine synthetase